MRFIVALACVVVAVVPAAAQSTGIPGDSLTWDQGAPSLAAANAQRYRVQWDGGAAVVVATICTGSGPVFVCRTPLPASMGVGNHTAIASAAVVLSDGRETASASSAPLAFTLVAGASAPGGLRLEGPPAPLVLPPPGAEP